MGQKLVEGRMIKKEGKTINCFFFSGGSSYYSILGWKKSSGEL